jgi:hypothetical protein
MKSRRITLVLALAWLACPWPSQAAYFNHSELDGILHHYVDENGLVDYAAIRRSDTTALDSYIGTLADAVIEGWPAADRQAFWINAYNTVVLYRIAHKPQLKKLSDAWDILENPTRIAGRSISPADMRKLLRHEGDPRILFSLSDGTFGGPKLCNTAYTAENLDVQLQLHAADFVNSTNYLNVEDGKLHLSRLFSWYAVDFKKEGGVSKYVISLLNSDRRDDAELLKTLLTTAYGKASFDYDWTINNQKYVPAQPLPQTKTPKNVPPDALSKSNPDLSKIH